MIILPVILSLFIVNTICSAVNAKDEHQVAVISTSTADKDISVNENKTNDPHTMKHSFIDAIKTFDFYTMRQLSDDFPYLKSQFNTDIFKAALECYPEDSASISDEEETVCRDLLDVITPSLSNFSNNRNPLVIAIRNNKAQYFMRFLELSKLDRDDINKIIDSVDEDGRSALMYASKLGNLALIQAILNISTKSVNLVDRFDRTALHYACTLKENKSGVKKEDRVALKCKIITTLIFEGGAEVLESGAKYVLKYEDSMSAWIIGNHGGVVEYDPSAKDRVILGAQNVGSMALMRYLGVGEKMFGILAPIIFKAYSRTPLPLLNNICGRLQHFMMPQLDATLNLAVHSEELCYQVRLNVLFLFLMMVVIKKVIEGMKLEKF